MNLDISHPRKVSREAIVKSLTPEQWERNWAFVQDLRSFIDGHRIMKHPLIGAMDSGNYNAEIVKAFHLEFGYAFAQIFTDAVLRAMGTCVQLERRLGPLGKMAPRFLLQLNMLDELGFVSGVSGADGGYAGNPAAAHYVKFHETLSQLGVSHADMLAYRPSPQSIACRYSFESTYEDHTLLTCVLACSESVFDIFAGPWARNTGKRTDVTIEGGYHSIHVLDEDGHGIDDDHSEDMWYVFAQAVTPERYDEIRNLVKLWIDTWAAFADTLAGG